MSESRIPRYYAPKGRLTTIDLAGQAVEAYRALHHSGAGPGLLLLADEAGLDEGMRARADLFGEEGYSVLALGADHSVAHIAAAADVLRGFAETDGDIAVVGHGPGGVLACRAAESAELATILQRIDPFPILPGYIDGLQQWPDSGIVNDVSLPLSRESLLGQQGVSVQEEISVGFQVIGFLLFGEPEAPRTVAALSAVTEVPEGSQLTVAEQPENRRRAYLSLASALLVEDLLMLSANAEQVPSVGPACPVDALRRATERMIRVTGMEDRQSVAGEYYPAQARTIALGGLQQSMAPWLAQDSALRSWLIESGVQAALPAPSPAAEPDILLLQQLHAGLSAGRSLL